MSKDLDLVAHDSDDPDLEDARRKLELLQIRRQQAEIRRQIFEEWTSWVVQKILGLGCMIVGGAEVLDPSLLPIHLKDPLTVLGVGAGLLLGNKVVEVITKIGGPLGK